MKNITKEMIKIYKPLSDLDWMNYRIKKSELTFHHIQKKENGGKETIENGAILMPIAHQYLHIIEYKEEELFLMLNKMFLIINKQGYEPTNDQRQIIEYLLKEFEEKHKKDKTSKGKELIKYQYLKRW